ncbi:hypothetical protein ES319_A12G276100v1 [Gossypium barbadense]|uniref:C2 domain-containing protein n=1 Tax=Gossypium barbadense TaxID=3634 RepID=A0A5J5TGA7_GOSBA|nr:hypothetical protein ES319_A12G276100v1 [Gossypium barbadense]
MVFVEMGRRKKRSVFNVDGVMDFFNNVMMEKPYLPLLIPLVLMLWALEKWIFSLSNWVPLVLAVWVTVQHRNYQHRMAVEDLNKKWKRFALSSSAETPLEHCEWLNKLLIEIWSNYINPKLSLRFQSIVEKRLKRNKSRLIEKLELLEFSLGSSPPRLGLQGTRWSTFGDQQVMHLGFDWDTTDISIMLLAKVAKPFFGTAKIVINSLRIKGDLLLMPILDGKAILYSFVSTPEVRISIAFGSGGSQSLPATELPGVSSWLVKLLTDTLAKTMVEPRRQCFSLSAVDLRKKAVGGIVYVTVISGKKLSRSSLKGSPSRRQPSSGVDGLREHSDDKDLQTFVEVELGELTRRTNVRPGSSPRWDSTFNMILHDNTGIVRFHLFEHTPGRMMCDYLASCEIKMRYNTDDSTTFWAIGPDSSVIARHSEFCGKAVEMVLPFEGVNVGEFIYFLDFKIQVQLLTHSQSSLNGSSNFLSRTGRRIIVKVVEGKDLITKDKSGKCNPYVKLQYGKVLQKTKTAHSSNPKWEPSFEFDEMGDGEYLKIKCYTEEVFGDDSIGSAHISLEGLVEGSLRDVWIPLEKVNSGELRIQIEAVRIDDYEGSRGSSYSGNGWIELVLIEAKDLVAADLRGTSDPYVRVQYGNLRRRTKVMYKTLNPKWHQTLEFPDNGSSLELHVKDHNAVLPTSSIGDCVVEYQGLPPNQMADKWIPLQGVKRGEIHVQVTRKVPELEKKPSVNPDTSLTKAHQISSQMKQMMIKLQSLIDNGNLEGISTPLSELEALQDIQDEYMVQLETEQMLLLNKIKELGQEMLNSSPSLSRNSFGS